MSFGWYEPERIIKRIVYNVIRIDFRIFFFGLAIK
jgi:hypothetical protein